MPDDAPTPPPLGAPRGARGFDVARFGMAVVRGASMTPTLAAGDRLLVDYRRRPRAGDVVLARFADGTLVVKRAAERRGARGWWLLSDEPSAGVDSRHRGAIAEHDVLAVVIARIWPRPRIGLGRARPCHPGRSRR